MSERDVQKLLSDHTALQNENTILKEQLALMQEQLEWFRKQFFGRKTEQMDCQPQIVQKLFSQRENLKLNRS